MREGETEKERTREKVMINGTAKFENVSNNETEDTHCGRRTKDRDIQYINIDEIVERKINKCFHRKNIALHYMIQVEEENMEREVEREVLKGNKFI